jgi:hypothetical protein
MWFLSLVDTVELIRKKNTSERKIDSLLYIYAEQTRTQLSRK